VAIWNRRIIRVGDVPRSADQAAARVVDWSGRFLLPGLIDSHIHTGGSHLGVAELARGLLRHGTTAISTDLSEVYAYAGQAGVRFMLDLADAVGLRILYTPPAHFLGMEVLGQFRHRVSAQEMAEMLDWPEAVGINEP